MVGGGYRMDGATVIIPSEERKGNDIACIECQRRDLAGFETVIEYINI